MLKAKAKKLFGFTLVELIIVIAIITILAGILVVTINPGNLFALSRNANRGSDLSTIQSTIIRYLGESPSGQSPARSLGDFGGYTLFINAAYATTFPGRCTGGSGGILTGIVGAATLTNSGAGSATVISLQALFDKGYLTKLPVDPAPSAPGTTSYLACVDNTNPATTSASSPGHLVIFAPAAEAVNGSSTATIPYVVI